MRAEWKRSAYFPKIATLISYERLLKTKQDHKTTESVYFLRKRLSKLVTCDWQPVVAKISYKLLPEVVGDTTQSHNLFIAGLNKNNENITKEGGNL